MTAVTYEDLTILARDVYVEARGSDDRGCRAVTHIMINRWRDPSRRRDHTNAATCLHWRQLSCWNVGDPNRDKLMAISVGDAVFRLCMAAALAALDDRNDTTGFVRCQCPSWRESGTVAYA